MLCKLPYAFCRIFLRFFSDWLFCRGIGRLRRLASLPRFPRQIAPHTILPRPRQHMYLSYFAEKLTRQNSESSEDSLFCRILKIFYGQSPMNSCCICLISWQIKFHLILSLSYVRTFSSTPGSFSWSQSPVATAQVAVRQTQVRIKTKKDDVFKASKLQLPQKS